MNEKLENFYHQSLLINPYTNPFGCWQHCFNPNMPPNKYDSPIVKYVISKGNTNNKSGIKVVGNYTIKQLDTNKYSVSVNNGNYGAKICTQAEVEALCQDVARKSFENIQTATSNYNQAQINMNNKQV